MSYSDDFVIGMLVVKREGQVLVVSSKGFGKEACLKNTENKKEAEKGSLH